MTGWELAITGPAAVTLASYLVGRRRLHAAGVPWPWLRDACFLIGIGCVLLTVAPPLSAHERTFPVHIAQHLLLAMAAPVAFALAAPTTLLLRTVPPAARRRVLALLRSRPVRGLTWSPVPLLLTAAPMWPLYLTGWYAATLNHPVLHAALHLHMFTAGLLLAVSLVGPDPIPGRGGRRLRTAVLFSSLAAHGVLAKYLYAHAPELAMRPGVGTAEQWRAGASLLFYGGELLDAVLLLAFFGQWYASAGRELRRSERRRSQTGSAYLGVRQSWPV